MVHVANSAIIYEYANGARTRDTIDVNVVSPVTLLSFRSDIMTNRVNPNAPLWACIGCHNDDVPRNDNRGPDFYIGGKSAAGINDIYRLIRDRTNIDNINDSLVIRKNAGTPHLHGSKTILAPELIEIFRRWVIEGAKNN